MARVDIPTLECDRCKVRTQDLTEMSKFNTIRHAHMSGEDKWDLCPGCYRKFLNFIKEDSNG